MGNATKREIKGQQHYYGKRLEASESPKNLNIYDEMLVVILLFSERKVSKSSLPWREAIRLEIAFNYCDSLSPINEDVVCVIVIIHVKRYNEDEDPDLESSLVGKTTNMSQTPSL